MKYIILILIISVFIGCNYSDNTKTNIKQISACNFDTIQVNEQLKELKEMASDVNSPFDSFAQILKSQDYSNCPIVYIKLLKFENQWQKTKGADLDSMKILNLKLYQESIKLNELKYAAIALKDIGSNYLSENLADSANFYILDALKIAKEIGDSATIGNCYKHYSKVKRFLKDTFGEINQLKNAIPYYKCQENRHSLAQIFAELAEAYSFYWNSDSAYYFIDLMYQCKNDYGSNFLPYYYKTKGGIDYYMGNYSSAINFFDSSLKYNPKTKNKGFKIDNYKLKFYCYQKLNNKFKMKEQIDSLEKYSGKTWNDLKRINNFKYEYFKLSQNYKDALIHLENYLEYDDSLNDEGKAKEIEIYDRKISSLKQGEKLKLAQQEKTFFKKQRWYFVAFTSLLLLLPLLILIQILKKRKKEYNMKLAQMQVATLKSQMNPHFMFNSINSIKGMIINNAAEAAADQLTKFSKLMRNILNYADNEKITLEKEIEFIKLYTELETYKSKQGIKINFNIGKTIDIENIEVLPFVIQPFVENCFKHAFNYEIDDPKITISINKNENWLSVEISDNGIGTKENKDINHESKAVDLAEKRLFLNNNKSNNIHYNFKGKNKGTTVVIDYKL